ncbi:MAG: hypothetical protein LBL82_00505 [Oscillospiraceae bacterium]|jgi:uncharacterized protein YxjI|nr:hypothetical protein [Oscillospiraceae bacterium]
MVTIKLKVKRHAFSLIGKYTIFDEQGGQRWSAQGEVGARWNKFHVFDEKGEEKAFIWGEYPSIGPRFKIYCIKIGNQTYIVKSEGSTPLHIRFIVEGTDWTVLAGLGAVQFDTTDSTGYVSQMKKGATGFDLYALKEDAELLILCVALAVDGITQSKGGVGLQVFGG